jgi:two-component system, OmpR family, alkaline phosphatase synthesis response regulator PhoP
MKHLILLVEDEEHIRDVLKLNLDLEGYEVITAERGTDAVSIFNNNEFSLVILDVMLPEMNGFDVCKEIRKKNSMTPILFLTAKNSNEDKIRGLKTGADDYMTKPFNLEEFLLRVQILLRRSDKKGNGNVNVRFGNNEINFLTYEFKGLQGVGQLTMREAALLKLLIEKKNQVVSRDEILNKIWGEEVQTTARTIDNYILVFRKYFEADPKNPIYFHSIRGVGYKFTPVA